MILRMLIPFILLLLLPDLYIYFSYVRQRTDKHRPTRRKHLQTILYWLPSLFIILLLTVIFLTRMQHESLFRWVFTFMLCLMIPKLVFTLFSLLGRIGGHVVPKLRKVGDFAGIVLGLTTLGILLYGSLYGWRDLTVKQASTTFFDLPQSFNGYRIVQFSDLHAGTLNGHPEVIEEMVELINNQHPDLIVFTGDLVNSKANELDPFMEILSRLKANDGVYSVLGNHDYGLYAHFDTPRERVENLKELQERQRQMGWKLLLNENRIIRRGKESIAIVGVENDGRPPFPSRGDLPRATQGLHPECFKVLLSHDPTHWQRKVLPETNIQLTLSGHTHGTQFMLGSFSPAQWIYEEWGGLYCQMGRYLNVSLGVGEVMFPFRFGAWPEINVITLHSAKTPTEEKEHQRCEPQESYPNKR